MAAQHLPLHRELRQGKIMVDERKYSSRVVDGIEQAPSRAMLYPTGFKKEDFGKPQIGVASLWSLSLIHI